MGSYKQQGLFCSVSENSDIKPDCVTIHAHWHELPLGIVYCGSNKLSVKIMCLRTIFIIPPKKHNFLKSCPITLVSVGPLSHSSFLPAKSLHMLSDISPISLNSPITQISQTLSIAHLLVLLKVRVFCRVGGGGGWGGGVGGVGGGAGGGGGGWGGGGLSPIPTGWRGPGWRGRPRGRLLCCWGFPCRGFWTSRGLWWAQMTTFNTKH